MTTLSKLIKEIAAEAKPLPQETIKRIVKVITTEITKTLSYGQKVELRGFGIFSLKHYKTRRNHNPATGEYHDINESYSVNFKDLITAKKRS